MASPSARYSKSASRVTRATPRETVAVEPHNTRLTTSGTSATAVATRFQVMKEESPENAQAPSHHNEKKNHVAEVCELRKRMENTESLAGYARRLLRRWLTFSNSAVAPL